MDHFSYNGNGEFEFHSTEEEARSAAEGWIEHYQDAAQDGWPDAVNRVCWGPIREMARVTHSRELCGLKDCDGECENPDVHHNPNYDVEITYELKEV